jgi:DnaJ-class molecular chaperone
MFGPSKFELKETIAQLESTVASLRKANGDLIDRLNGPSRLRGTESAYESSQATASGVTVNMCPKNLEERVADIESRLNVKTKGECPTCHGDGKVDVPGPFVALVRQAYEAAEIESRKAKSK